MMMQDQHGNILKIRDSAQDVIACDRMAAHFLPFVSGQRPVLAQHGVRHGDFPNIMQVGGYMDERGLVRPQPQRGCKHKDHLCNAVGVAGGIGIAGIQRGDNALAQIVILQQARCRARRGGQLPGQVCHESDLLSQS